MVTVHDLGQLRDEESLIAEFVQSRMWQWFKTYLESRRDNLINTEVKDGNSPLLWKQHGAIHELNRLLKAPDLMLQAFKAERERLSVSHELGDSDNFLPAGRFTEGTDEF